jgi:hypothetical protein
MEWLIPLGVNALLEILRNKKQLHKWLPAIAKVYVEMEIAAKLVPDLAAAIAKKRKELGLAE